MSPGPKHGIRRIAAAPTVVVLVCRKCSRKLDGGFGPDGDEKLAKVLARAIRSAGPPNAKGRHKPRRAACPVIEVGCLDLCPKGAVVVLRGDRPDDWLVVPRGTSVETVGAALGVLPGSGIGDR